MLRRQDANNNAYPIGSNGVHAPVGGAEDPWPGLVPRGAACVAKGGAAPLPAGKRYILLHLLSSERLYVVVDVNCRVRDVFHCCCGHIGLRDREFFGLCQYAGGEWRFLDESRKLVKYTAKHWRSTGLTTNRSSDEQPFVSFYLRVKVYLDHIRLLRCPVSLHHYYLQLRENALLLWSSASHSVAEERCWEAAALALNADTDDDSDPVRTASATGGTDSAHRVNGGTVNRRPHTPPPLMYFPRWVVKERGAEYCARNLRRIRADLAGMSRDEAKIKFCRAVSRPPYRVNLHVYRLSRTKRPPTEEDDAELGVAALGIEVYDRTKHGDRILLTSLRWAQIAKLSFEKRKFIVVGVQNAHGGLAGTSSGAQTTQRMSFYTGSNDKSRYLLQFCQTVHRQVMELQSRILEARRAEMAENSGEFQEKYVYEEGNDSELKWLRERVLHVDQSTLSRSSIAITDTSFLPQAASQQPLANQNVGGVRVSMVSDTSSATTSGIVSDRLHAHDDASSDPDRGVSGTSPRESELSLTRREANGSSPDSGVQYHHHPGSVPSSVSTVDGADTANHPQSGETHEQRRERRFNAAMTTTSGGQPQQQQSYNFPNNMVPGSSDTRTLTSGSQRTTTTTMSASTTTTHDDGGGEASRLERRQRPTSIARDSIGLVTTVTRKQSKKSLPDVEDMARGPTVDQHLERLSRHGEQMISQQLTEIGFYNSTPNVRGERGDSVSSVVGRVDIRDLREKTLSGYSSPKVAPRSIPSLVPSVSQRPHASASVYSDRSEGQHDLYGDSVYLQLERTTGMTKPASYRIVSAHESLSSYDDVDIRQPISADDYATSSVVAAAQQQTNEHEETAEETDNDDGRHRRLHLPVAQARSLLASPYMSALALNHTDTVAYEQPNGVWPILGAQAPSNLHNGHAMQQQVSYGQPRAHVTRSVSNLNHYASAAVGYGFQRDDLPFDNHGTSHFDAASLHHHALPPSTSLGALQTIAQPPPAAYLCPPETLQRQSRGAQPQQKQLHTHQHRPVSYSVQNLPEYLMTMQADHNGVVAQPLVNGGVHSAPKYSMTFGGADDTAMARRRMTVDAGRTGNKPTVRQPPTYQEAVQRNTHVAAPSGARPSRWTTVGGVDGERLLAEMDYRNRMLGYYRSRPAPPLNTATDYAVPQQVSSVTRDASHRPNGTILPYYENYPLVNGAAWGDDYRPMTNDTGGIYRTAGYGLEKNTQSVDSIPFVLREGGAPYAIPTTTVCSLEQRRDTYRTSLASSNDEATYGLTTTIQQQHAVNGVPLGATSRKMYNKNANVTAANARMVSKGKDQRAAASGYGMSAPAGSAVNIHRAQSMPGGERSIHAPPPSYHADRHGGYRIPDFDKLSNKLAHTTTTPLLQKLCQESQMMRKSQGGLNTVGQPASPAAYTDNQSALELTDRSPSRPISWHESFLVEPLDANTNEQYPSSSSSSPLHSANVANNSPPLRPNGAVSGADGGVAPIDGGPPPYNGRPTSLIGQTVVATHAQSPTQVVTPPGGTFMKQQYRKHSAAVQSQQTTSQQEEPISYEQHDVYFPAAAATRTNRYANNSESYYAWPSPDYPPAFNTDSGLSSKWYASTPNLVELRKTSLEGLIAPPPPYRTPNGLTAAPKVR